MFIPKVIYVLCKQESSSEQDSNRNNNNLLLSKCFLLSFCIVFIVCEGTLHPHNLLVYFKDAL